MIYDVAIIGGSYAGMAAAIELGRMCMQIALIDEGQPRNSMVKAIHNLPGNEGISPTTMRAKMKSNLEEYDKEIAFFENKNVINVEKKSDHFVVTLSDQQQITSKKIIFATGVKDQLPDIKNINDYWGKNIFQCPYCSAYEVKDKPLAVYSTTAEGFFIAKIVKAFTKDLILLTNGQHPLTDEQIQELKQLNITIDSREIASFNSGNSNPLQINFTEGTPLERHSIFMHPPIIQRSDLPKKLGCELNDKNYIKVNENYETIVPGVYACGDMVKDFPKVILAQASALEAAKNAHLALVLGPQAKPSEKIEDDNNNNPKTNSTFFQKLVA